VLFSEIYYEKYLNNLEHSGNALKQLERVSAQVQENSYYTKSVEHRLLIRTGKRQEAKGKRGNK
jgi:hypothetical protein